MKSSTLTIRYTDVPNKPTGALNVYSIIAGVPRPTLIFDAPMEPDDYVDDDGPRSYTSSPQNEQD